MIAAIALGPATAFGQAAPDRWLAPDKALHVAGGYDAAALGYAAGARLGYDPGERRAAAIAAGVAAGLAKEAWDRWLQDRPWSWKDLVADGVGIALLVGLTAAAGGDR